ncbi:MAG: acyl-CoA synthetase [Aestuariivita sp.]|nr:acyl-CoA synthetase [Aestuariivita sp.]
MAFSGLQDKILIENEMSWENREVAVTLLQRLTQTAKEFSENKAVSYQLFAGPQDKAETLTWSELLIQVTQAANLFRSLGIGENDVVAYVLPNCTETVVTLLGGAIAGIVNPINPLLSVEQISAILRETNAKIVVTLRGFPKTDVPQKVAAAVQKAPNVYIVLEVDLVRYLTGVKKLIVPIVRPRGYRANNVTYRSFTKEISAQPTTLNFDDRQEDRVACYFHTGGTTGTPKVARHKYSGLIYNGWLGNELLFSENDSIMCPLPLFHVFACHVILMAAVTSGAHVVFPTPQGYRGDGVFDNFWKLCERWNTTFIITVPTAISAKMQRPVNANISTVKRAFSGSAPLPLNLFKRFEEATGISIVEGYGLTEATCLVSCNPIDGEKKVGSIGIPFPYTDVKIIVFKGEEPVEAEIDEIGEICVSNPGINVGETYTEADKNNDLYYGDYLRTGDLGRIDADNYLWITGRAKDIIIRSGHNIDPAIIEEAILGHPSVAFAGAIGQPDAHAGEIPCVYVELVAGVTVTSGELLDYTKTYIGEKGARPSYLEILSELPKTAVGKVFKPDLRKSAIIRIYNQELESNNLDARVTSVIDDKKRGLVALVKANGTSESDIGQALGQHIRPWELV